jgi:aryl-alcohol dehydrogenase-like predicted oxidoreductase
MERLESRPIGRSGVAVTTVGLGGVEIGPEEGEEPDIDRAVRVLEASLAAGVNWLDTSESYCETRNESLIGDALRRIDGDLLVSSKVAPRLAESGGGTGHRRAEVHAACRASLRRLGREQIDIYLLHWPDETGVPLEETWGAMAELVDAGLVRAIGLSNYGMDEIERCHAERSVDVVQEGLSLIDYLDARESIARCGALGIAVVVYEPLASGVLSGRTIEQVREIWTGWEETGFYKRLLIPGKAERSAAVVEGMRPIAEGLGLSVAQLAIVWVLHQPGVTAALGGSRDGRHVHENAEASRLDLAYSLGELEKVIPLGPAFAPEGWPSSTVRSRRDEHTGIS